MSEKEVGTTLVLGLSVAAVSAATKLLNAGYRVEIYEIEDDLSLREQFLISDGGLGNHTCTGSEYEDMARDMLRKASAVLKDEFRFLDLRSRHDGVVVELRQIPGNVRSTWIGFGWCLRLTADPAGCLC